MMMKKKRIIIMAIKPKYAEAIYSGKKRWEFRDYIGKKMNVAACATFFAQRTVSGPIPLPPGVRPPQNWGRYILRDESEAPNG